MATISTELRHFKEPDKEDLNRIFFAVPPETKAKQKSSSNEKNESGMQPEKGLEKMEVNAVLSLGEQGLEDSYVSF